MKDDSSKTLSSGHFHNNIIDTPNYSLKVLELSVKNCKEKHSSFFVGVKAYTLVLSLKIKDYRKETISKGFTIDTIFKGVRIDTIFKGLINH
jgi:hypothetical protein